MLRGGGDRPAHSGARKVLAGGELGAAVQGTATLPGPMEPVTIDRRQYVDGSLSSPVPVDAARELGAARVVAVDVSFPPEPADLRDPCDVLYQAFSILTRRLALPERADLVAEPPIPPHGDMRAETIDRLVEAGHRAAVQCVDALRAVFGTARGR